MGSEKLVCHDTGACKGPAAQSVSNQVMRRADHSLLQRKCNCGGEEEGLHRKPTSSGLQRKEDGSTTVVSNVVSSQIESAKGSGNRLPEGTRNFMESRFGTGFSNVRIHDGSDAARLSTELNAHAFTVGNDIFFNSGRYAPESSEGKKLLAHELTHTLQQNDDVRRQAAPKKNSRSFRHHNVNVVIRAGCDDPKFGLNKVETSFKAALDKIFDSDCIQESRRKAIQANLVKNGYDVRCLDSKNLVTPGACAESTGFFIPANIMTLGSDAFGNAACGNLASTILHEIIHIVRGRLGEDLSTSCEASCFGGPGSPDLCKNIDVTGHKH